VTVALVMSVMTTTCHRRETNRMLRGSPDGPAPGSAKGDGVTIMRTWGLP
jgi:hypothetical protein